MAAAKIEGTEKRRRKLWEPDYRFFPELCLVQLFRGPRFRQGLLNGSREPKALGTASVYVP